MRRALPAFIFKSILSMSRKKLKIFESESNRREREGRRRQRRERETLFEELRASESSASIVRKAYRRMIHRRERQRQVSDEMDTSRSRRNKISKCPQDLQSVTQTAYIPQCTGSPHKKCTARRIAVTSSHPWIIKKKKNESSATSTRPNSRAQMRLSRA